MKQSKKSLGLGYERHLLKKSSNLKSNPNNMMMANNCKRDT